MTAYFRAMFTANWALKNNGRPDARTSMAFVPRLPSSCHGVLRCTAQLRWPLGTPWPVGVSHNVRTRGSVPAFSVQEGTAFAPSFRHLERRSESSKITVLKSSERRWAWSAAHDWFNTAFFLEVCSEEEEA